MKNWNEVNIGKYYSIINYLNKNQETDEIDNIINIISILENKTYNDIESYNIVELNKKINKTKFLTKKIPTIKIGNTIMVNDIEYHINYDIPSLKTYMFLDLIEYLKQKDNIHLVLSLILKPIKTKKRNRIGKIIYEYDETIERNDIQNQILEYMSIVTANSILVFFSKVWKKLIVSLKNDLLKQQNRIMRKMIWKRRKNRQTLMTGLNGLRPLQKQLEEVGQMFTI